MTEWSSLRPILAFFPAELDLRPVRDLGSAGGYSGARFWLLESRPGPLALRRWPPAAPSPERLAWIHRVLEHVYKVGFTSVPVPIRDREGRTVVQHGGHQWELAPWLPGEADLTHLPLPPRRLQAALKTLACYHRAAESFPPGNKALTLSPGIGQRRQRLTRLLTGETEELARSIRGSIWLEGEAVSRQILSLFSRVNGSVDKLLQHAATLAVPLIPCLRDVWTAHVLFIEDEVTGLVDFGAMRPENVAADVARLLGSAAGDDQAGWHAGLAAYEAIRPLTPAERQLVRVFDQSTVLLGGLHWIDWIYRQERSFDDMPGISRRLEQFAARLAHLAGAREGR